MDQSEAMEIFEGVMLSDGAILDRARSSYFRVSQSGKEHMDWLSCIREAVATLGVYVSPAKVIAQVSRLGKPYDYCYLQSGSNSFLREQSGRWYPYNKKEVPVDFHLTPIVLANWFTGDGCSSRHKQCLRTVVVTLCTESFNISSIQKLENELAAMGLRTGRCYLGKGGTKIRISIPQGSVNMLMSIIEPYVLPSYRYKLKFKKTTKLEV